MINVKIILNANTIPDITKAAVDNSNSSSFAFFENITKSIGTTRFSSIRGAKNLAKKAYNVVTTVESNKSTIESINNNIPIFLSYKLNV